MSQSPLAGLRVVEFAHMVMGPSCGLALADLGADVIKVEPAAAGGKPAGDNTRRLFGAGTGFFAISNRNKRSLVVDLKIGGRDRHRQAPALDGGCADRELSARCARCAGPVLQRAAGGETRA